MTYSRDAGAANPRYADSERREQIFERGQQRVATIAEVLEATTGATLDGRRALDFGCGVGRLAIPLAERCEHVYGLDISTGALDSAAKSAEEREIENVEWLEPDALASLSGRYDFAITVHVLQHIRRPQGEDIIRQLVRGLGEDGAGWINLILRPGKPVRSLLRWGWRGSEDWKPRRRARWLKPVDLRYYYMLRNSYSLDRLGRLLAEEGVENWHVRLSTGQRGRSFDAAALVFRKD